MGHIIIVSGPPGSGKSTVSRILAEDSPYERAVCVHTDDFYGYIRNGKGFIEPWLPGAGEQNIVVSKTMVLCAKNYAEAGYEVLADGLIGDWFLNHWIEGVNSGIDVHYAILLPSLAMTVSRDENRGKQPAPDGVTQCWNMISGWTKYESHFIDSTSQTPKETAVAIRNMLNEGYLRIK